MIVYRLRTRVVKVYERETVIGGYVDPATGETVLRKEKQGWFAQISESVSLFLGMEQPELAAGDEVEIEIRKLDNAQTTRDTEPT